MRADKAPFPWYGGKSQAAPLVWQLLGDVDHYCEPFAGSLAVLLQRPHECNRPYYSETVNDSDGLLVNAWRSIQFSPDATAEAASWPVTECCKTARQISLLAWRDRQDVVDHLAGDPLWHDPVMGGWWLWAVAVQIGAFSGDGPWTADPRTGRIRKMGNGGGVARDMPNLTRAVSGVNRETLREPGVSRDLPHLSDNGRGVNHAAVREPGVSRDLPFLSMDGQGVNGVRRESGVGEEPEFHPITMPLLRRWMHLLSARLRHVRVLNGDWSRLCTKGASHTLSVRKGGHAGLFLDPPYGESRASALYAHDSHTLLHDVREWALRAGTDPHNRIVLAGFEGEHGALTAAGWTCHEWFVHDSLLRGGMGDQQHRERLWASPACLAPEREAQLDLFAMPPVDDAEDAEDERFADLFAEAAE